MSALLSMPVELHKLNTSSNRIACAQWHRHINAVNADARLADYLIDSGSLTTRLTQACAQFRVQRLHQLRALCLQDEFQAVKLARPLQVMERDVLLRCDEAPVVYAHTVLPLAANASQWPLFASLGNRSLGSTLFNDPLVKRGALCFARLGVRHPLMRRIAALGLLDADEKTLFARRSVFERKGSRLLVTEVFLSAILRLPN